MGLYDQGLNSAGGSTGGSTQSFTGRVVNRGIEYFKSTGQQVDPNPITLPSLDPSQTSPFLPITSYGMTSGWVVGNDMYQIAYFSAETTKMKFIKVDLTTFAKEDLPVEDFHNGSSMIQGAVYNNKLVFIPQDFMGAPVNDKIYLFDTVSKVWSIATTMPTKRSNCTTAMVGSKIYFFSGMYANGTTRTQATTADAYDFATNTWETHTNIPAAKNSGIGFEHNGKIILVAGSTATTFEYDPVAKTYVTRAATSNIPVSRPNPVGFKHLDRIYVVGSDANISVYRTSAGTWGSLAGAYNALTYINGGVQSNGFVKMYIPDSNNLHSLELDATNLTEGSALAENGVKNQKVEKFSPVTLFTAANTLANNWLQEMNGKFYGLFCATGNSAFNFNYSKLLWEVDLITGYMNTYTIPDTNGWGQNGSNPGNFLFAHNGKVYIFPYYKLANNYASPVMNRDTTYVFDTIAKTFEKVTLDPVTLSSGYANDHVNTNGIDYVTSFIYKDKLIIKNGVTSTPTIKAFDMIERKIIDLYSISNVTKLTMYLEGSKLHFATMKDGSASSQVYGVIDLDTNDVQYDFTTTVTFASGAFGSYTTFYRKGNTLFYFTGGSFNTLDMYDIGTKTWHQGKLNFKGLFAAPALKTSRDGKLFHVAGNDKVEFNGMETLYTATEAGIVKIIKGEVVLFDENDIHIGTYNGNNQMVDIPVLPGFTIRHFAGERIVVLK